MSSAISATHSRSLYQESTTVEFSYIDLTTGEAEALHSLITQLGEKNWFRLKWDEKAIKQLGSKLDKVHPLKFLEAIFTNENLSLQMIDIFGDMFKKDEFMKGISENLEREAKAGKLIHYAEEFAKAVNKDAEQIKQHFCSLSWEKLVGYLLER